MSKKFELVEHSKWGNPNNYYYINSEVTKLIIGTMPPEFVLKNDCSSKNNKTINFFYGSNRNKLWKNLLFHNDYTIDEVKEFLNSNNIGIIDIVKKCIYNDKYDSNYKIIESNINNKKYDDKSLLSIEPITQNEMLNLFYMNKNIKVIFFTSKYAFELFNIFYTKSFTYFDNKNKIGKLYLNENLSYIFYILMSPSGTTRIKNEYLKKEYKILSVPIKKDGYEIVDFYHENIDK